VALYADLVGFTVLVDLTVFLGWFNDAVATLCGRGRGEDAVAAVIAGPAGVAPGTADASWRIAGLAFFPLDDAVTAVLFGAGIPYDADLTAFLLPGD
jgi:hypothetical protein